MKKIFTLLFVTTFLFTSCSDDGEPGPQGPPGEDGLDGLAYTLEEQITFDYYDDTNSYSRVILIPDDVQTINPEADAVLVYRYREIQDNEGNFMDTWSLIPQNFFLNDGTIQYVYNHTASDVEIIIEGNFDLSNLSTDYTNNQIFRVVVVPSNYLASHNELDITNYNSVMKELNIETSDIKILN